MPKEISKDEYIFLMRPENKPIGFMPYRYYTGDETYEFYFLTLKQAKVCYWFEHTFCGDIEFNNTEIILTLDNSIISIRDSDSTFHIRFDRGWCTLSEIQGEIETISKVIELLELPETLGE